MSQALSGGEGGVGGRSGTGGTSGLGGASGSAGSSGSGGTGGTTLRPDASVPMPDGGTVMTICSGRDDFDDCEDGKHCTVDDYCLGGVCVSGRPRVCSDDCNTGTCIESEQRCELTPLPNDTECGFFGAFVCMNGQCTSPIAMCTEGGDCTPTCIGRTCDVRCPNANSCQPTCSDSSVCNVDCQNTSECKIECESSSCMVMCQGSGTCDVDCSGGATCAVICTDKSGCDETDCLDGSACTIQCTEEDEDCGFRTCWAGEQQPCDDGRVVCGIGCDE